ncbi:MFS transporter [Aureibacillus halotolerans]|uniref:MFS transporter n=1 Tax=Aureibacillus halotolerans TaxID=1508390 RepID=A0A4R6U857_9BACI|nr:MFS transporter [Aureibacillus halotolerans]
MNVYIQLLKNTYFRHFFVALTLLNMGRKLTWVALGWFVYQTTGSLVSIGIVITASTVAPLLSSVLVGGVLDQYNRRSIMIVENGLRGVFLSLIPILHWLDLLNLPIIVAIIFVKGFLSSFTTIGVTSILPSFLRKEDLEPGNAVLSMTGQMGSLIGPAIGGISTAMLGAPLTLLINVICFFIAAVLYFLIPTEVYHKGMERRPIDPSFRRNLVNYGRDVKDGLRFILKYRVLMMIALVTFVFNFCLRTTRGHAAGLC